MRLPITVFFADGLGRGNRKRLSGSPTNMWIAAHAKHVSRQPKCASPQALRGHPIVLANPANSVMPVIEERAPGP